MGHLVESDVEEWWIEDYHFELVLGHSFILALLWFLQIEVAEAWQVLKSSIDIQDRQSVAKLLLEGLTQTGCTDEADFGLKFLRV